MILPIVAYSARLKKNRMEISPGYTNLDKLITNYVGDHVCINNGVGLSIHRLTGTFVCLVDVNRFQQPYDRRDEAVTLMGQELKVLLMHTSHFQQKETGLTIGAA
jgi:hypothetical protein